jgi:hypothetical protein
VAFRRIAISSFDIGGWVDVHSVHPSELLHGS